VKPETPAKQAWHRRIVQAMLYGRGVDRGKKAKAQKGKTAV
jgi:hypothetical protein